MQHLSIVNLIGKNEGALIEGLKPQWKTITRREWAYHPLITHSSKLRDFLKVRGSPEDDIMELGSTEITKTRICHGQSQFPASLRK